MKYVYIFLLSLFTITTVAQNPDTAKVIITGNCWGGIKKSNGAPDTVKTTRYACRVTKMTGSSEPLLVVDGIPVEYTEMLRTLNRSDIDEVYVLKSSTSQAIYGCRAFNGAIIITTRKMKQRIFRVTDFVNGAAIGHATIRFENTKDHHLWTVMADEKGCFTTDQLKSGQSYQLTITSAGYQPLQYFFRNKSADTLTELKLSRNTKNCDTAYVTGIPARTRGCGIIITKAGRDILPLDANKQPLLGIFPNPVRKGQALQVQWKNENEPIAAVRITTLDGKIIHRQTIPLNESGKGNISLITDSRWAAGVYFLQTVCENGRIAASGKILIQ
ncbi:MAG: carboxypeptidase regulatory-like domain-containing protein [Bacteroidetes bacterium]|nr:carboxypeptidase regulatory-like domain-containing protein [Bacteroidota bacterium]